MARDDAIPPGPRPDADRPTGSRRHFFRHLLIRGVDAVERAGRQVGDRLEQAVREQDHPAAPPPTSPRKPVPQPHARPRGKADPQADPDTPVEPDPPSDPVDPDDPDKR